MGYEDYIDSEMGKSLKGMRRRRMGQSPDDTYTQPTPPSQSKCKAGTATIRHGMMSSGMGPGRQITPTPSSPQPPSDKPAKVTGPQVTGPTATGPITRPGDYGRPGMPTIPPPGPTGPGAYPPGVEWGGGDGEDGGVPPPPPPPGEITTIELDILSDADDSDEKTYNCVNWPYGSSHYIGDGYINGFRFVDVPIPQGAAIKEAYLSFYCYTNCAKPISIRYVGEAAGNALPFSSNRFDISSRSRTDAEIPDNPFPWNRNDYNPTEELTPIIQEIIDQPDWRPGNAMVIFVHEDGSSSGYRVVNSHDSHPQTATKLIISYYSP